MCPRFSSNYFSGAGFSDAVFGRNLLLGEHPSFVILPHFNHIGCICFYGGASFSFSVVAPSLPVHVLNVFKSGSSSQVRRVAACSCSNAGMKNPKPRRNQHLILGYPCHLMASKYKLNPKPPKSDLTVTTSSKACLPNPASVRLGDFYLGPKKFLEIGRKYLLQKLGGYTRFMHSVSRLIVCHAFGHANDARALSF